MLTLRYVISSLCLLTLTLCLVSCGCETRSQTSADNHKNTLNVMSFNIRYGDADDGENSWPNRKGMVCRLIGEEKPDVLGLQEALHYQIDTILQANPEYAFIGVGREDGRKKGEFSPILYRKDMFTPADSGTFWLSDTPSVPGSITWGNACTRICTWARLLDRRGRGFYVYNLHLDHVSQPSREKSVIQITELIASREHPEEMFIMMGDFNAGEDNPVIEYLKGSSKLNGRSTPVPVIDTFRRIHPDQKDAGTSNKFSGRKDSAKIDYIFTAPETKTIKADILHTNINGRYPSDHYPVTAQIRLDNK
jgi:endonuclease/exonuclease/phosphatase family metal-dependent hydrolase